MDTRGWRTQAVLWEEEKDGIRDVWMGKGLRRIGDSTSWIIDLPGNGMPSPKLTMPDTVLTYSELTIRETRGNDNGGPYDNLDPFYAITAPFSGSRIEIHVHVRRHLLGDGQSH